MGYTLVNGKSPVIAKAAQIDKAGMEAHILQDIGKIKLQHDFRRRRPVFLGLPVKCLPCSHNLMLIC